MRPSGGGGSGLWDAASLSLRLAAMTEQDPELKRFGADYHGYRLRPPLADRTIRSFERESGVRLPESYRRFLAEVADGGAGPYYGVLGLTEQLDDEDAVHDLREECLAPGFLATPFPYTRAIPGPGKGSRARYELSGTLVIAEAGCGMFARLVVTGKSAGQVWFDDPDWGGLAPGPDFRTWYTDWLESTG